MTSQKMAASGYNKLLSVAPLKKHWAIDCCIAARAPRRVRWTQPDTQTKPDQVRPSQTQSDPARPSQSQSDPVRPSQTLQDPVRPSQTQQDPARPSQTQTQNWLSILQNRCRI
jgi:hypothetical protein